MPKQEVVDRSARFVRFVAVVMVVAGFVVVGRIRTQVISDVKVDRKITLIILVFNSNLNFIKITDTQCVFKPDTIIAC